MSYPLQIGVAPTAPSDRRYETHRNFRVGVRRRFSISCQAMGLQRAGGFSGMNGNARGVDGSFRNCWEVYGVMALYNEYDKDSVDDAKATSAQKIWATLKSVILAGRLNNLCLAGKS